MEKQEVITLNGQQFSLGQLGTTPVVHAASPWAVALVTSVVGAVAGWTIEEVAKKARGRRR